ncbi:MAG: hypothetical protein IJX76_01285 [Clostridia bacterium]|nr:hypothetical protein [Clostridia bacterium]
MKILRIWITILLTAVLLAALPSCGGDPDDSLSYQEQECVFTGVCKLEDGDYTLQISLHTDGSRELLFLSPETLSGCRYIRDAAGAYSFICEDTVLPVAGNPTVETVFGLFELKESDLLSAELEENAGEGLNVLTFAGDVTVYLSSADGLPLRFEHPLLTLTLHADGREVAKP